MMGPLQEKYRLPAARDGKLMVGDADVVEDRLDEEPVEVLGKLGWM